MLRLAVLVLIGGCGPSRPLPPSQALQARFARAHVAAGSAALRESPPRATTARAELRRALDLHRRGAALSDREVWIATEGIGVSYLAEHDFATARTWLEAALRFTPDPAQTHYNLACARCGAGDREGCIAELESALAAAVRFEVRDPSPRTHRSPAFWVLRARSDPDLAALRGDSRFEALASRHLSVEMRGMPAPATPTDIAPDR
ncbi:MAG: hypothetical protein HYY06_28170 [Deltaproteobacteria bacterium]|nr:hypothetical protein [Deltaproteobacteria bacterium]